MKETLDQDGNLYIQTCECDDGPGLCDYHADRESLTEAIAAHPVSWKPRVFNTADLGPRVLTFTLKGGREVMVTQLDSGEVILAERERADHTLPWSAPLRPTHDSAVTWR
jgi:hypothetical protein